MPAQMTIDQSGLSAGVPGRARTDGLATGALVTITNTGSAQTTRVRLLWVPPEDTSARVTLAQTGANTWTFTPSTGVYGTYRIELTTDLGLPTQDVQVRVFGIRLAGGLLIPAANEVADALATLENNTASVIAASENNEPFSPFNAGSAWGWWKAQRDLIVAVDALQQGGGMVQPLWAWNGIDVSQFDPVIAEEVVNAPTYVADAPLQFGPQIEITGTWTAGGTGVLLLPTSEFVIPASGRFVLEMEASFWSSPNDTIVGFWLASPGGVDLTSLQGVGLGWYPSGGGSTRWKLAGDPGFTYTGSTPGFPAVTPYSAPPPDVGPRFRIPVEIKQGAGGNPCFAKATAQLMEQGTASPSQNISTYMPNDFFAISPGDPIPSGWDDQEFTQLGIMVSSINAGAWSVRIRDMVIWPHPLDY